MATHREILATALEKYLREKTFPEMKSFRLKYEENWSDSHDDFDYLLENWYFNKNERSHYVLRLKGLHYINNSSSNAIINTANSLIPVLKVLYRRDQSDNRHWTVEEVAYEAQCEREDVEVALFFMQDVYTMCWCGTDQNNKMLCTSLCIREGVLKIKTIEEWLNREDEKEVLRSKNRTNATSLLFDLQNGGQPYDLDEVAPDFSTTITDKNLAGILKNRWDECNICVKSNVPLAATIMMGGLVESILLIKVKSEVNQQIIIESKSAPRDKNKNIKPYGEWTLAHLIELSSELEWITKPTRDISTVLKEYRNFIHPHREHVNEVKISVGDSKLFWAVSKEIVRQLVN